MATKKEITVSEAAELLGRSRQRVIKLVELGLLPARTVTPPHVGPSYFLIPMAAVEARLKASPKAGRPAKDTLSPPKKTAKRKS